MTQSASWLDAPARVWEEKYKAPFPFGQAARAFDPLVKRFGHSPDTIAAHLAVYLDKTESRFVSLSRFAQTFASWNPASGGDVSVDADGVLRG